MNRTKIKRKGNNNVQVGSVYKGKEGEDKKVNKKIYQDIKNRG